MVPRSAVPRYQGGGQRTAIIFEALRDFSPTIVVVLGEMPFTEAHAAFPDAAGVHVWPDFDIAESATTIPSRAIGFARKYFLPATFYHPLPGLREKLAGLRAGTGPAIFVFRLFKTLTAADIYSSPTDGAFVVLDVDDRDDQKAEARLQSLFGTALVRALFGPLCVRPLHRLFAARLRRTSSAWFATKEDAAISGIRTALIENAPLAEPREADLSRPSTASDIIFVGPSFFPPNLHGMRWFLHQCWPELLKLRPDATLRIVGGGDWTQHLAGVAGRDRIDVRGFVQDVAPEYLQSRLAICPLKEGGGSKVKLIEACAYGRPVVATSHSMRGFADVLTNVISRADTAPGFAAACAYLLAGPDEADARGNRLRAIQEQLYSRTAIKAKIAHDLSRLQGRDHA